jgi:hypothetical protein
VTDLWPLRRAAQQPGRFTVDWRLTRHLASVQMASQGKVTLLMNGCFVASVDPCEEGFGDIDGWCNIFGRSMAPPPALGLKRDELLYPAGDHPPGTVLDFSIRGSRVFVAKDHGQAQLAGVVACSPSGVQALREAIAEGTSPLIIWADGSSLGALPSLPAGKDHTLVLVGLRAPIEPLTRVRNLTRLHVAHASPEASDLRAIAHLTGLKSLVLRGTPRAESLKPLARMAQLASLELALSPRVRELGPLAGLTQLKALRLSSPRQLDLNPLGSLPNLRWLDIAACRGATDTLALERLQRRGVELTLDAAFLPLLPQRPQDLSRSLAPIVP